MDRTGHVELPTLADWDEERDQVVVLHGVSWAQYEGLLRTRGNSPRPLLAYLDGELEIVTTSRRHEFVKKLAARLVEAYAEETEIALNGFGHATLRKKLKKAGAEPDEWYCIGPPGLAPDLAIEIVHTSGGVDKLEIYRRLKAAEVWFWIEGRFWIYRLVDGEFKRRNRSIALPRIDLAEIERIVGATDESRQTQAVRAYRRSLKRR